MKSKLILSISAILLVAACGTKTFDIDMVRDRLNKNKCKINREDLIFQVSELEYLRDTTFTAVPTSLLEDSVCVCPATTQPYLLVFDGNDRTIACPVGHGESSF